MGIMEVKSAILLKYESGYVDKYIDSSLRPDLYGSDRSNPFRLYFMVLQSKKEASLVKNSNVINPTINVRSSSRHPK